MSEVKVLTKEEWVNAMVNRGMDRREAEEIVRENSNEPFPVSRAEGARRGFLLSAKRKKE